MVSKGYLLDTHILVWYLQNEPKLDKTIREDIEYFQYLEKLSTPFIENNPHKDQFDRTIISQGIAEGLTVISADTVFPLYTDKGFRLLEN